MTLTPRATAAVASVLVTAALALTGCVSHPVHETLDAYRDKVRSNVPVPGFVAPDATDITAVAQTHGYGSGITWLSDTGITSDDCAAGPIEAVNPEFEVVWWPETMPTEGWTCGQWVAFASDGRYFAWDAKE